MDEKLLDILACPICKQSLMYVRTQNELICKFDKLAYPIKENIPIMLVEEARRLDPEELE